MSVHVDTILRDPARLAALRELALLDSAVDPAFDRLTRLATKVLGVPTALVSLVDEDRQFFKSCIGLAEPWATQRQTPLSHSFCQYAVASGEPFIVEDAHRHPLVDTNLAITDLDVVAYAGIPLVTSDGFVIGTVCAIDRVPRSWTGEEIETLRDLASMVMTEIELRSEIAERQRMMREREVLLEREQAARAAAEEARGRFALLADASRILAGSLAYETTLTQLADLIGCTIADHCELYLHTTQGLRLAGGSSSSGAGLLATDLCADPLSARWAQHPLIHVLQRGTPVVLNRLTAEELVELAGGTERLAKAAIPAPTALIAAPIAAGERLHGLLVCTASRPVYEWSQDDVMLVAEIGRRIGAAAMNAELYRESVQAVRTRDDVLAVVTHDLRSPMQAMQIYSSVLQELAQQRGLADGMIEEAVTQIGRAGNKMSRLVAELTDVAMLQAGQAHELRCSAVELVGLVGEVIAQQQPLPRHSIRVSAEPERVVAVVDRERIERVLENLLGNAIKYSPDGGEIAVTMWSEQRADQEWVTLEIRDCGLGIPPNDLRHIWEPFFRGSNLPNSLRGMGLGLASVRQIVQQHRGMINVASTEEQGTTFTVRLPATGCD